MSAATGHGSRRGMLYIAAAVFLFASMDVLAKIVSRSYPVSGAVWARYFVHLLFMLAVLGPRLGSGLVRTKRLKLQLARGVLLVGSTGLFYLALKHLPLAEACAIGFVSPLMVVALSGPLLKERVTPGQWVAVSAGFAGVLIMVQPGSSLLGAATLLPIGAATCYSLYQILTRKLSGRDSATTTLFYTALVGTAVSSIWLPFQWQTPTATQAVTLCAMGLLGGVGHFLLIKAVEHAPPSTLAPVIYSQLVWATLYSVAVFGDVPDGAAFAGMLIIVASGLYTANWRQMRRAGDRVDQVDSH